MSGWNYEFDGKLFVAKNESFSSLQSELKKSDILLIQSCIFTEIGWVCANRALNSDGMWRDLPNSYKIEDHTSFENFSKTKSLSLSDMENMNIIIHTHYN